MNAGHNPPLIVHEGKARTLDATGPVVGLILPGVFQIGHAHLEPGDLLLLYTDGVTEAENVSEAEYGMDRLTGLIEKLGTGRLEEISGALFDDLAAFAVGAPPKDDTTAVLVRASRFLGIPRRFRPPTSGSSPIAGALAAEMGEMLRRTAISTNVKGAWISPALSTLRLAGGERAASRCTWAPSANACGGSAPRSRLRPATWW